MNNKKNNRGFTIIELLITITLMLSLLGIAIVSFINISNNRKKESWELVKEQIITAGEQYFENNGYLFEGLGNAEGKIAVGLLVDEDYLNVVTNPITGKAVAYCSYLKLEKKNGKVQVTGFVEGTETDPNSCPSGTLYELNEIGGPRIEVNENIYYKKDKKNDWWNSYDGNPVLTVTANEEGNGKITSIKRGKVDEYNKEINFKNIEYADTEKKVSIDDTLGKSVDSPNYFITYTATNEFGYSATVTTAIKIDKTAPTINLTPEKAIPEGWSNIYNDGLYVTTKVEDKTSKINKIVKYQNDDGSTLGTAPDADKWVDEVTNLNVETYTSNKMGNKMGFDLKNYKDGNKRIRIYACDNAGNCNNNSITAKIDTEAPNSVKVHAFKIKENIDKLTMENYKNNNDGSINTTEWVKNKVFTYASAEDKLSGIESYYHELDLKRYDANNNTFATNWEKKDLKDTKGRYRNITSDNIKTRIRYNACDKAGNCSSFTDWFYVYIDNAAPEGLEVNAKKWKNLTESTSPSKSDDSKLGDSYKYVGWSNRNVYTYAGSAKDAGVGGIYYQYKKEGDTKDVTEWKKSEFVNIKANGTSYVIYRVCDKLNNCKEKEQKTVKIDKVPPVPWKIKVGASNNTDYYSGIEPVSRNDSNVEYNGNKSGDGPLVYDQDCGEGDLSGISKREVKWELSSGGAMSGKSIKEEAYTNIGTFSSKSKDGWVEKQNYEGTAKDEAYKFTNAREGSVIKYAKRCTDNAGNISPWFKINITVKH